MDRSNAILLGWLAGCAAIAAIVFTLNQKEDTESVPYDFVCFDQYQKTTTHLNVVSRHITHGGVWIMQRSDGEEGAYMQQHGETCWEQASAQVPP